MKIKRQNYVQGMKFFFHFMSISLIQDAFLMTHFKSYFEIFFF